MKDYFNLGEEYMFYNNILISGVIIIAVIALLLFVLDYYISHNFRLRLYLGNFFKSILKNKIFTILLLATLIFVFIFISLMIKTFNGGEWKFSYSTLISKKIGEWGDFATCLGAIFALTSTLLAYRAFISQVNAAKRTSFDTTFTQIFAQHHILHEKVVQHSIITSSRYSGSGIVISRSNTIFSVCRNEYTESRLFGVGDFWENFNDDIGNEASIDFRNYFKYIYHEINIVVSQPDEVLDDDAKRRYIQLIQAQMNYDELFCYLINQIEYLGRFERNYIGSSEMARLADEHVRNLLRYRFFYELCKSYPINNLVKRVFDCVSFQVVPCNRLVRSDWFFIPREENR